MPQPATVDLRVNRNGDYGETWIVAENFDANGTAIGVQDLTGWTAELQVRLYGLAGGPPLISLGTVTSPVQGIYFIEPSAGQMEIRIDWAPSLENLPSTGKAGFDRTFAYDLVLTDPAGVRSVYATGSFIVPPGVTR